MSDRHSLLRQLRRQADPVKPDQLFVVEPFRPEDGEGLARLFYSIYGESYPVDTYYDPDAIRRVQAAGDVQSYVARLDSGDIAGHAALYKATAPFPGLLECGLGMVHPHYRGTFILFHLFNELMTGPACAPSVDAIFGEAVCDKTSTQQLSCLYGLRECGVELNLLPGTVQDRVSCLLLSKTNRDRKCRVHLPAVYEETLRFLLGYLPIEREILPAQGMPEAQAKTEARVELYAAAQVLRVNIIRPGRDIAEFIHTTEADALKAGCLCLQWFVNLGHSDCGAVVDLLHDRGCFLGGIIPRWFDDDGMLMQKLLTVPNWDSVILHSDMSHRILGIIRKEYEDRRLSSG